MGALLLPVRLGIEPQYKHASCREQLKYDKPKAFAASQKRKFRTIFLCAGILVRRGLLNRQEFVFTLARRRSPLLNKKYKSCGAGFLSRANTNVPKRKKLNNSGIT